MISKNSCLVDSYDLAQFCAYVRILYFSIFENTYCIHIIITDSMDQNCNVSPVLQVYIWFTGSGLNQFMSTYGNNKDVTSFIPLMEKNDGGKRHLRFCPGESAHRGYAINVKALPAQLVRRFFSLVCIVLVCDI